MNTETADLVLSNGAVYTLDAQRSWAQALAISSGRIVYVGDDAGVRPCIGSNTEFIDLQGRMVLPGFFDSHLHPYGAADLVLSANLHHLHTLEAYQEAIVTFVQAHPSMTYIRGGGWSNTVFPTGGPHKATLDRIVPDRPAALRSSDGHSWWVNSKTLELAGITRDTPNPEGGVIERNPENGDPTGTLRESAMDLVNAVIPDYTSEEKQIGLRAFQEMAAACGVTSVLDAHSDDSIGAYKALEAAGALTVRYRGSLLVDPHAGPEQVPALVEERAKHTGPHFQTNAAKIFVDGVVEGETAYLLEPYTHRPDYRGELLWDVENLKQVCVALDKAGFQIHVHSIGDAATRITLDAIEFARETNGARDSRHLITHLQLVHPQDISRFAELGVVGLPQPFWFSINPYYWNLELPYLGKERADAEYPMQSLIDAGVVMASGSDFPVTVPFDPLIGIQIGVTRSHPGRTIDPKAELKEGDFGVLWPAERAGLADMIASFTINGAYANFLEQETGSLQVGKLADVLVLERNLFEIPVTEISTTPVLLTLFEGEEVYKDSGFSA